MPYKHAGVFFFFYQSGAEKINIIINGALGVQNKREAVLRLLESHSIVHQVQKLGRLIADTKQHKRINGITLRITMCSV